MTEEPGTMRQHFFVGDATLSPLFCMQLVDTLSPITSLSVGDCFNPDLEFPQ